MTLLRLCLPLLLGLLAGCSGMRLIDSDVSSFARWQAAIGAVSGEPGTTYRFERLPSQDRLGPASGEPTQAQLEAAAQKVLDRYGLVHKPEAALLTVQLSLTSVVQPAGFAGGLYGGPGISLGTGTGGSFIGLSFPILRQEPPLYVRELSLVMRDSRNHAVVYETRARHSGPWGDAALVPALLDAALDGFPQPPAAVRRVKVEIPR